MIYTMFSKIFMSHKGQKITSLLIAICLWLTIHQSLTMTKTVKQVAVKVINIPSGMTVKGLLENNILAKKVNLTLQGNKHILKDLTPNDLEIVLDATDKSGEWLATVSHKNLVSLNPDIDFSKAIRRMSLQQMPISFVRLVTEKIPVIITQPIGEAPQGFQFLDVSHFQLMLTVSGPEEKIKKIKAQGINLTFNLNDVDQSVLEEIDPSSETISFKVPDDWKYIDLPSLSLRLFIDDPKAQDLELNFIKSHLHPITKPIPVSLFFSAEQIRQAGSVMCSIIPGGIIEQIRGQAMISQPLFAGGTSRLFAELVQDMLYISVTTNPNEWCIQFQNPQMLEDRYVSLLLSDEEMRHQDPCFVKQREGYLRNRFRSYMNHFRLYRGENKQLQLDIDVKENKVYIQDAFQ